MLFLIAGVPYALVLAAIGGALEFLPVVGPAAAGITVVSVALFSGFEHPWLLALFVVIWRLAAGLRVRARSSWGAASSCIPRS